MGMKEVSLKRFIDVVTIAQQSGKTFPLQLSASEITGLHGAIALAMNHPYLVNVLQDEYELLQRIRHILCQMMVDIGFTEEEVEYIDKTEVYCE